LRFTFQSVFVKGKVIPVLNEVPRHEDVWVSGCVTPCILHLCTSLKWLLNFMLWPLYPGGKNLWYPLHRRLGGPQLRNGRGGIEKKIPTWTLVIPPIVQSLH